MFTTEPLCAPSFIPEMIDRIVSSRGEHQLHTSRLFLRPVNESDLIDFIELFSDSKVMEFVGLEAGYIPKFSEIEQLHSNAVKAWKMRGYGRWALFDWKTNEFVGFCGFRSEEGQPELICMLHEKFWFKGLATEATAACLSYGFDALGFTEVKAFTRPMHTRARKVLDKLNAEFLSYVDFHGIDGAAYVLRPDPLEF
jgi:RimJ/RimL family protein N-acetyltransferase